MGFSLKMKTILLTNLTSIIKDIKTFIQYQHIFNNDDDLNNLILDLLDIKKNKKYIYFNRETIIHLDDYQSSPLKVYFGRYSVIAYSSKYNKLCNIITATPYLITVNNIKDTYVVYTNSR